MKTKLKKGDLVMVMTGKSAGTQGKIARILSKSDRVIVEGANIMKKRERPRREGQKGQVVELASPIHLSNVQLFCSSCGKAVRVGYKISGADKARVCRTCGKEI